MNIVLRKGDVQYRVKSTPEACFQAASVLALVGLLLAVFRR
jgi:hypothetical protein